MPVIRQLLNIKNQLALSFDDGPDPKSTPMLLNLLDQYQIKAFFFLIGEKLIKHPQLAREILARGHALGNHSQTHAWSTAISKKVVFKEIQQAQENFAQVCGVSPRFYRPPRGLLAPWLVAPIKALNMEIIKWTLMPGDYYFWHHADRIQKRVIQSVKGGDILVFHDGLNLSPTVDRHHTLKALSFLIPQLLKKNFEFVRLDEGINSPAYQET